MCLETLKEFRPCTIGYKIVRRSVIIPDHYRSLLKGSGQLKPQYWLDELSFRSGYLRGPNCKIPLEHPLGESNAYPIGWHICHTKAGALDQYRRFRNLFHLFDRNHIMIKVKVRKALVTGYQLGHKITVAKEIFIIGEVCMLSTLDPKELSKIVPIRLWKYRVEAIKQYLKDEKVRKGKSSCA